MPAPKIIVSSGYQPDLDRLPPRSYGCGCTSGIVILVLALIASGAFGVLFVMNAPSPATSAMEITPATSTDEPTSAQTATLDDWSATGTALYLKTVVPTVDYCFWLTPTATTATLVYTPDAWQATGTAIYLATNPHVPPTSTPDIPRVWCNNIPSPTPTLTPLSLSALSTETPTTAPTKKPPVVVQNNNNQMKPTMQIITQPPAPPAVDEHVIPLPTAYNPATETPKPPKPPKIEILAAYCVTYPEFIITNSGGPALDVSWSIVHGESGMYASMGTFEKIAKKGSALAAAPFAVGMYGGYTLFLDQVQIASILCVPPETTAEAAP
jgi:hypothetical protein